MQWTDRCIGIDGCPAGWVAVSRFGASVHATLADLFAIHEPNIAALDMPIGLPDNTPRECDRAARRLLGRPRGSSVFPAPMRATLAAAGKSHAQASDVNAVACGKRISAQAYNILSKIAEVDALLHDDAGLASRVVEVHPEVSFTAMNEGQPVAEPKRSAAGRDKRQTLIARFFGEGVFNTARTAIARRMAADDDIADAFACLFTAERIARGQHVTLPDPTPHDSAGLPMRILY